ncbi:MAG: DNA-directed RNA polymerase, partial [Candidatus Hydrothermarchaeales archaeon]
PEKFGKPLKTVIEDILKGGYEYTFHGKLRSEGGYEGRLDKELGMLISITQVKDIKGGSVIPGDGAAYHTTTFEALTIKPELHEIVDGEVVEIVEFGAFIRFGPLDGLIHVSQITDDYISYDNKRGALVGKESGKALEVGDKVRARIVAVSLNPERTKESKINLTMRQPGLGKLEWLLEGKPTAKKEKPKAEKKEKEKEKKKKAEPEKPKLEPTKKEESPAKEEKKSKKKAEKKEGED